MYIYIYIYICYQICTYIYRTADSKPSGELPMGPGASPLEIRTPPESINIIAITIII